MTILSCVHPPQCETVGHEAFLSHRTAGSSVFGRKQEGLCQCFPKVRQHQNSLGDWFKIWVLSFTAVSLNQNIQKKKLGIYILNCLQFDAGEQMSSFQQRPQRPPEAAHGTTGPPFPSSKKMYRTCPRAILLIGEEVDYLSLIG